MTNRVICLAWALLLALASSAAAQQKGVAVTPFGAQGAEGALAQALTSVIRTEVSSASCARLVAEGVIEDLARQMGLEQQCGAESCQIDLARSAKADLLVRGELAEVDGRYLITGMLIDLSTSETLATEKAWAERASIVRRTEELGRRIAGQIPCPQAAPTTRQTNTAPGLLVYGFSADEDLRDLADGAAEFSAQQLDAWSGMSTFSSTEVNRLADERGYGDWKQCATPDCLRDIALALGASEFLTVGVHRSKGLLDRVPALAIAAERRNTRTGEVIARTKDRWTGSANGAGPAIALDLLALYVDPASLPPGAIRVVGDNEKVFVAGALTGRASSSGLVIELPTGRHEIAVQVEGQASEKLPVVVIPKLELRVPLGERTPAVIAADDAPFYKTWWFWALVVGGTAAGVGAGIAASGSDTPAVPSGGQPVIFTVPAP